MARPRAAGWIAIACAVCLSFVLRLPSLRWDAISDDEGIYDATAQALNMGGLLYRDAVDHKPPGLAYAYAWATAWLGPAASPAARLLAVHALGALVALGTAVGLWRLGCRLLPVRARLWPPMLFALSSTAKVPFDGLAVNGELMLGLPSIWALVLVEAGGRRAPAPRAVFDFAAGALCMVAILFKWQAALLFAPMAWMALCHVRRPFRAWPLRALVCAAGAAALAAAVGQAFVRRQGLKDALDWGLWFNGQYLAAGTHGWFWALRLLQGLVGAVLPSVLVYRFGLHTASRWLRHPRALPGEWAVALWALLSLLAVALGGRFFGHYFLQAELPLCLLAAGPMAARWQHAGRPRSLAPLLIAPALGFFALGCWPERALGWLNPSDPKWPALGHRVAAHADPGDTLFVWGNAPLVYHFSGLPMGTRFSFCNYLTGLSPATPSERSSGSQEAPAHPASERAWAALLEDFAERKPAWVLDTAAAGIKGYGRHPISAYPRLQSLLARDYELSACVESMPLYGRRR